MGTIAHTGLVMMPVVVLLALIRAVPHVTKMVVAWRALHGARPADRPEILRALAEPYPGAVPVRDKPDNSGGADP